MSRQFGILLFECLLAMAVMAVLLFVFLPGAKAWVMAQRNAHVVDHLRGLLFKARELAMRYHEVIRCCGSSDALHCDGMWSQGWVLQSSDKKRLHYEKVSFPSLSWHQGSLGRLSMLIYSPQGGLASSPGHFEWGRPDHRRYLYISESGRLRAVL